MPTYDYKCTVCSYTFELFQPITAEPVKICPECKGEVKRIIGPGLGLIFKGKGFYQTDYKVSNSTSETKNKTSHEIKSSGDTSNTKSKPETNSEKS
jgi:putative FmdB family regulatory protein